MTESVRIFVPGVPVPKGRPRFGRSKRGRPVVFTPPKTRAYEDTIRLEATLAMKGRKPFTGPVKLRLTAWFPIPKSWPVAKRRALRDGFIKHTGKPDLDNIVKMADALNGIAVEDDSQIFAIDAAKYYSEIGCGGLLISVVPA